MTIVYKNAGPWGAGSGAGTGGRLTSLQGDNNFYDVDQRIVAVEALITAGFAFSDPPITVGTASITFHFNDGSDSVDVVVPLPVASFRFRGAWQNDTEYLRGDMVLASGIGTFLVLADHTTASSPAEFDPDESDSDSNFYVQIGGITQSVSVGQIQSSATWTPALADANTYNEITNVAGCLITIPANSSVAFPLDTEIHVRAETDGSVIIEGAVGVTIREPHPTEDTILPWRGATITLKKRFSDTWDYIGLGTEASA